MNEYLEFAKKGELCLVDENGMEIDFASEKMAEDITQNLTYNAYVLKEDFDNGRQWNDRQVAVTMQKIFERDRKRKKLQLANPDETLEVPIIDPDCTLELPIVENRSNPFTKLKDKLFTFMTQLKNRNLKKLDRPVAEVKKDHSGYYAGLVSQKLESDFDRRYKVKEEDLIPMDVVKEQTKQNQQERGKDKDRY